MAKSLNGSVQWRWLGPVITLVALTLASYIGKGVVDKANANELRIQELDKSIAVQQEILERIETKIDSLLKTKEK